MLASTDAYALTATYVLDASTTYTASISMTVVHGDLYVLTLDAVTLEDGDTGDSLELTADDGVQFSVAASDAENNPISTDGFSGPSTTKQGRPPTSVMRCAPLDWCGMRPSWATTPSA